jgi:hypothetical protein
VAATTDELVAALRNAGRPLTARELRDVLGVDRAVLGWTFTKVLNEAVASGRVVREGRTAGTRYRAA